MIAQSMMGKFALNSPVRVGQSVQYFSNLGDQNVGIFLDAEKGHVITFFNGDLATIS